MTTKLSLYQGACQFIGARKIASLTEERLTRRELDGVFARGGIRTCLKQGQWNFAMRTAQMDYSPSAEPDFGYRRAFDKPTDWVRTCGMASDEYFKAPLTEYVDEAAFWYADLDTIYTRFVSDGLDYGMDYSKWPDDFARYVEGWFGLQIHDRVVNNANKKEQLKDELKKLLLGAKARDAMDEAAAFLPAGTWSSSRRGSRSRGDRGNRGQLIG